MTVIASILQKSLKFYYIKTYLVVFHHPFSEKPLSWYKLIGTEQCSFPAHRSRGEECCEESQTRLTLCNSLPTAKGAAAYLCCLLPITPALMPIKPFIAIQFINPLEITLVCWVSEFNTRFIAKWQLQGVCFQYCMISLRFHSTVPFLLPMGFWVFLKDYCRREGKRKLLTFSQNRSLSSRHAK